MNISVILRTRNEEKNIEHFCYSYNWVDHILVADGGSNDNTVEMAWNFSNVQVRKFEKTISMKNGYSRNPHGEHLNFLIDWAKDIGSDWIIHDDCDCFPNYLVKRNGRRILEESDKDFIYIPRIYVYKHVWHFPKMSQPIKDGVYEPSLWGWRAKDSFRFKETDDMTRHQEFEYIPDDERILKLYPPYCLIHCPWQDDDSINRKIKFYRESGEVSEMIHPIESGGVLESLPKWVQE